MTDPAMPARYSLFDGGLGVDPNGTYVLYTDLLALRQEVERLTLERGGAQFFARVVPFSSVVGSSVTLHDDTGKVICQLSLLNTGPMNDDAAEWKRRQIMLATEVTSCINTHALVASAHNSTAAAIVRAETAEASLRLATQRREDVTDVMRTLIAKLDECQPHIGSAFAMQQMRSGFQYSGPTYADELEAARTALQPKEN